MAQSISLAQLHKWLTVFTEKVAAQREYLTGLDAEIGDADHGSNMARGTQAAADKLAQDTPADIAALGKTFGMTLVSTVGGASGPLFGTLFLRFGVTAGAVTELDIAGFTAALKAGVEGVLVRGKAQPQDKTMVDVLNPVLQVFEQYSGASFAELAATAAQTAASARDETADMVAKKGRASYLGERSVGHIDPGSASTALLFEALAEAATE